MNNFQVGDIVKVINGGKRYTTYTSKMLEMYEDDCRLPLHHRIFKEEYLIRYAYASDNETFPLESIPNEYKILYLYEHFALIQGPEDLFRRVYLIDIEGIEKIKSKERIYLEGLTKDQLIDMFEKYFVMEEVQNEKSE